jgi:NAD(P)-dependent dehydrogenase (short-subunit alcohol dehydrogenase family)
MGPEAPNMQGKVVVITGGTSGIGQVAAQKLAGMGARIVLVARDRARGEATLSLLRTRFPGAAHCVHYADLSRLAEMKRVASGIAAAEPRIDVLINNAGALFNRRQVTEDSLESTFATNHVSYFVMTLALWERLLAAAPARVINTASHAHRGARLDFGDLQMERGFRGFKAYSRSKLCNILFTRELARRLAGSGVTANSLHPGFVATRFGDQGRGVGPSVFRFLKRFALSPEQGAETIVYLASSDSPAAVSGEYFYKCRVTTPSKEAQDDATAQRLWQETARLAGIDGKERFDNVKPLF